MRAHATIAVGVIAVACCSCVSSRLRDKPDVAGMWTTGGGLAGTRLTLAQTNGLVIGGGSFWTDVGVLSHFRVHGTVTNRLIALTFEYDDGRRMSQDYTFPGEMKWSRAFADGMITNYFLITNGVMLATNVVLHGDGLQQQYRSAFA